MVVVMMMMMMIANQLSFSITDDIHFTFDSCCHLHTKSKQTNRQQLLKMKNEK